MTRESSHVALGQLRISPIGTPFHCPALSVRILLFYLSETRDNQDYNQCAIAATNPFSFLLVCRPITNSIISLDP